MFKPKGKKIGVLAIMLVLILGLVGCTTDTEDKTNDLATIIKNKGQAVIIVKEDGCPACEEYLKVYSHGDFEKTEELFVISSGEYIEEYQSLVQKHVNATKGELNEIEFVPLTIGIDEGELTFHKYGALSEEELKEVLDWELPAEKITEEELNEIEEAEEETKDE